MNKISKKDIISAINEIDSNPELRKGRASSTYDLLYNNVEYPPKLVISIANKFATGEKLNPNDFDGGIGTPAFKLLEGFGFEIEKKRDPTKLLIENYKKHIKSSKLKDEVYKWELINEFKGKPNTDAVDFYQEVKSIKFKNLVYAMGIAVLNDLTEVKPEEMRSLFKNLFDESKDLTDRITKFSTDSLKIYRDLGRTLQHHQDERSIATYLTYHNNEKYTLYKSSFYKRYCQLLGINEAEKNKKYVHYLKLIDELIENYIKVDAELIDLVKSYIPKFYDGSNNKLLAQDILYTMLQKETNNEEVFEIIEEFIEQGKTTNLKTISYPKTFNGLTLKVSFGQGVPARIPWIGLTKSPNTISKGIYPVFLFYKEFNKLILAYGISETEKSDFDWINTENLKTIKEWHLKEFNKNPDRYGASFIKGVYDLNIALDKDLIEKDLKEIISEYNKLSFGSNYNKRQYWIYQPGKDALRWSDFYEEGIMGIKWDELGDLKKYKSRVELRESLINNFGGEGSKKNDVSANDDFANKIRIDDIIIAKKGISTYLGYGYVSSEYYYDEDALDFKSRRKVNWIKKGEWIADHKIAIKTLTDISTDSKYIENVSKLIGIEMEEQKTMLLKKNEVLNQILYGPPGTGKTYNTVLEAAKIVTGNEAISYEEALKIFNDNLGNQIEFITFHQNYSYEDFIQGIRPDTENGKELTFEKKDGVFKRIADRALDNLKLSEKAPNELSNEALFDKALDDFKESILESEDKYQINETAYIYEVEKEAFRYTGEKWGYINGLRMKFVDLKEFYRNNVKSRKDVKSLTSISGLANQHATYYYLVYEQILKHLPKEIENPVKVEHKNFVIIIDEINRANISRVFGELITLIEEDKRSHGAIPMRVTLPSGDPFIVPSNLYIIGTMNTADKSIALLDIALRRRFDFVPMYPLYDGLEKPINDVEILQKINDAILSRKNHDFTIGHAYFMGKDYTLENTINKKVIPLLLEYFMNDEKEITSILQVAGIKIGGWPLKMI